MSRRVVITGMGWVTPLGSDVDSVWTRLLAGESAIGPITRFDASTFTTNFAAEVKDHKLADFLGDAAAAHAHASLNTKFALAAASQAWVQAGLGKPTGELTADVDMARMGIYLGAGEGSMDISAIARTNLAAWDEVAKKVDTVKWAQAARENLSDIGELEQEPHLTLSHLAHAFGCRGPSFNCMTACAASTQAVGEAYEQIRRGDSDLMFAGGAHTMIHPMGITGFIRLTALSARRDDPQTASRPFDSSRDGFVMGEGAGILVLEELEHAIKRGATPLCEVAGFGSSADAYRITDIQPEGKGGALCMTRALGQAGIEPTATDDKGRPAVHYISAHGTGTQENDSIETRAVKRVFGELAPKIPFSSIKSMMGHLIQAAGAVELITCVQAIRTGFIPPTMNLHTPDAECDLDNVANEARDLNPQGGVDLCLSNSFGFGGQNDTICVRRFDN